MLSVSAATAEVTLATTATITAIIMINNPPANKININRLLSAGVFESSRVIITFPAKKYNRKRGKIFFKIGIDFSG